MKSIQMSVLAAAALSLGACAPRNAYVGPVSDFAAAQGKLSSAVKSDVEIAAATDRIRHVRKQLSTIAEQVPGRNITFRAAPQFLCESLVVQEQIAFEQAYIGTTATNMSAIAKPPPEKFEDLVKQLGERYQIRVDEKFGSETQLAKCRESYDSPDKWKARYPLSPPGAESAEGVLLAAEALYKFVSAVGRIILTEIDDARRARAFSEFFGDEEQVKELRANIAALKTVLSTRLATDRAKAHQNYEAAYLPLQKMMYSLSVNSVGACGTWRTASNKPALRVDYPADPRFRACIDGLWAKVEPTLQKTLTTAAAYDPLLQAKEHEAFAALDKSIEKMQQLANGKIDNMEELIVVIQAVVKIFKTVDELQKTIESDETKAMTKKVTALLETFR